MFWVTETGERLIIAQMQTSHIFNCIRMCERLAYRTNVESTVAFLKEKSDYVALTAEFQRRVEDGKVTLAELYLSGDKHAAVTWPVLSSQGFGIVENPCLEVPAFEAPSNSQLENILFTLREWLQDNGLKPDIHIGMRPDDWAKFAQKARPNSVLTENFMYCGMYFRPEGELSCD